LTRCLINRAFRVCFEHLPGCSVLFEKSLWKSNEIKEIKRVSQSKDGKHCPNCDYESAAYLDGRKEAVMAAKDGTNRGGARPGAGRKPKPLAEKLQDGQNAVALLMPEDDPFDGAEIEDIKKFLSEDQRTGDLYGKEIFEQMVDWLRKRGCAHLVSPHLLEQYAMAMARWIQLERVNSEFGFVSKHPTTGAPITSPIVTMAQGYLKQANVLFQQIFAIVSENCREPVTGNPQDDIMEKLLGM